MVPERTIPPLVKTLTLTLINNYLFYCLPARFGIFNMNAIKSRRQIINLKDVIGYISPLFKHSSIHIHQGYIAYCVYIVKYQIYLTIVAGVRINDDAAILVITTHRADLAVCKFIFNIYLLQPV